MDYYTDCKYESDTCDYYIYGECNKGKSKCPWEVLENEDKQKRVVDNMRIKMYGEAVNGTSKSYGKFKDEQIEKLWEEFEDVLFVEGNDLYEEDNEKYEDWKDSSTLVLASEWNGFDAGTDRETIWCWFNKQHSKGVNWLINEYEPLNNDFNSRRRRTTI